MIPTPPLWDDELDKILDKLTVRTNWVKPKPFAEDRKLVYVGGKRKAKAALQALILRAQIAELEHLWQCENGRHQYFFDKKTKDAFTTADRIATLQQQLKEVEESKQ